jgi:hypothetical protein
LFPVRRGEAKARFGLQKQAPSSVQSTRKFFSGRRVSADPPCLLPSRQRLPSLAQSSGCLRDSHTRAASSSRRRPWPKLAPTWGCFGDGRRGSFSISLDIGDRAAGSLRISWTPSKRDRTDPLSIDRHTPMHTSRHATATRHEEVVGSCLAEAGHPPDETMTFESGTTVQPVRRPGRHENMNYMPSACLAHAAAA